MKQRTFLFVVSALVGAAGIAGVACSSSPHVDTGGGMDSSVNGDGPSGDQSSGGDAGTDSANNTDGAMKGNCSPARGPACDLVLQNCAGGKECVVALGAGGGPTTACQDPGTGNRPLGSTCCPGQQNQCVPGLECIGPSCTDGGMPTARCTPHCCPGEDSVCAQSVPEGFHGSCDLTIVEDFPDAAGLPVFQACTYKGVCKPFHVQSCPPNYACLLQSDNVSFRCSEIYSLDGGSGTPQDTRCTIGNECQDGLECLGPADGGPSKCTTTCYHPDGGPPPFDAGGLTTGGATYGGCSTGKGCGGTFTGAPPWLGFCTP